MAYIHQCFMTPEGEWDQVAGGTPVELLATVQATLRGSLLNERRFWIQSDADIHEDAQGALVTSIYCPTCEKFVVSFDELIGRDLLTVEEQLADGAYAADGIVWLD